MTLISIFSKEESKASRYMKRCSMNHHRNENQNQLDIALCILKYTYIIYISTINVSKNVGWSNTIQ